MSLVEFDQCITGIELLIAFLCFIAGLLIGRIFTNG